jgi:hypothetical protein
MKTVDKSELFRKLQKAVELELATIPPYLTALLSLHPEQNVESASILRSVFMEEMLHMTLAANILSATGGRISLGEHNIPVYPLRLEFRATHSKERELDVHLAAFSKMNLATFLQIELPEQFAPARSAISPPDFEVPGLTIGEFYRGIRRDLVRLCEEFGEQAIFSGNPEHQISEQYYWRGGGRPIVVRHLDTASRAIDVIVDQGEGADGSLWDGDSAYFQQPAEVAHYFRFNEVYLGRRYRATDRVGDEPSGEKLPVDYGRVFPIKTDCKGADYASDPQLRALNDNFNARYSLMLSQLEEGFNGNPAVFYTAIMNGMHGLPQVGRTMVRIPIKDDPGKRHGAPTFEWLQP